jgi:hypothetical protein
MKCLLLAALIASCACLIKEENFVDVVVEVKHFFYSGCVFVLQDEECGK